jgi:hypothetical protein
LPGINTLDFVTSNNFASPHGFRARFGPAAITGTLRSNAIPRVATTVGEVRLLGSYTNFFTASSEGWQVQALTFVAPSNGTILEFEGITPGVWLDHVTIRETGRKYYLPEEPMAPLLGRQGFGDWTLQIWDSRLGALATNGTLLGWRLNLSFVGTNPPLTVLEDGIATNGTATLAGYQYYRVDVPCDAAIITNTITSSGGAIDLLFNQNTFPTGSLPGDVMLASNVTSATVVLEVGYAPLLRRGPYYLAVRNTDTNQINTFTIRADIAGCTNLFSPTALSISGATMSATGMTLTWTAEPGSEFTVLYASDPMGPWVAIPTTVTSPDGIFSYTDDGSETGGLSDRRFYYLKRVK